MTTRQALNDILSRLDAPLVLVDVGARWGAPTLWEPLLDHAKIICFEPDAEEVARLNAQSRPSVTYLPVALGDVNQPS